MQDASSISEDSSVIYLSDGDLEHDGDDQASGIISYEDAADDNDGDVLICSDTPLPPAKGQSRVWVFYGCVYSWKKMIKLYYYDCLSWALLF